jgi:hypothetical protein
MRFFHSYFIENLGLGRNGATAGQTGQQLRKSGKMETNRLAGQEEAPGDREGDPGWVRLVSTVLNVQRYL